MQISSTLIKAVVFDIGETLVNETRQWEMWADWLRIPRLTFLAALGSVIERGEEHRAVFEWFRPGFDLAAEQDARQRAGCPDSFLPKDFYPDAEPAIRKLQEAGFRIGIAANQPAQAEETIRALKLDLDLLGSSDRWGVKKPDERFFARIASELTLDPALILHVGDRLDNDILPAQRLGMRTAFLRRGPWGWIHSRRAEAAQADLRIDSLLELPGLLATCGKSR